MPAHFGNTNRKSLIVRMLIISAIAVVTLTTACSGNQSTNSSPSSSMTTDVSDTATGKMKNPLTDLAAAAAAGKPLYSVHCAFCHGAEGKGDNAIETSLAAKPTDLTTGDVTSKPDGEIFLAIKNGKMKSGKLTMPPAKKLTDDQIWQIVAYVRILAKQ